MADAGLGIAASIAGLVSLADIVYGHLRRFVRAYKDATQDIKQVSSLIRDLAGVLHSLELIATDLESNAQLTTDNAAIQVRQVLSCYSTMDRLQQKLGTFHTSGSSTQTPTFSQKLKLAIFKR